MKSLYATSVSDAPTPVMTNIVGGSCDASNLYRYQKDLEAWNACLACGRQGFGTAQDQSGNYMCDTSQQKADALASCPAGPVNPCFPMARPLDPLNPWTREQTHSWGASVYDPKYGTFILWGTWDEVNGRPYFAADAPYMRAGQNGPCPTPSVQ